MAPDEHLLSLLPELGASVTVPSFSNWVADVAVPAAVGALAWSCLQVAVDISWFTRTCFCDWPLQPCFHFRFFPGPAGPRVFSSSLPSLFPCFPLPSLLFLSFSFLCVAFVFLSSSPLLVGWFLWFRVVSILGSLLPSPVLGLRLALCILSCSVCDPWVGASARPMRLSCSLCDFPGLGLRLAPCVLPCSVV